MAKGELFRGKYKPESFIIPGQDQNGVSVRVYCRVVPLLDRAIDKIHGSHRFPFRTQGDLMRWCIKTGVDTLDNMEPVCGSVLVQADTIIKILQDEELNHTFMTVFNTMAATIGMHVQAQALGEARRVVAMVRDQVMGMEDGYWRDRYLTELNTKFGYLMDNVQGAGFGSRTGGIDED